MFHLHPNRNFRYFLVNGKRSRLQTSPARYCCSQRCRSQAQSWSPFQDVAPGLCSPSACHACPCLDSDPHYEGRIHQQPKTHQQNDQYLLSPTKEQYAVKQMRNENEENQQLQLKTQSEAHIWKLSLKPDLSSVFTAVQLPPHQFSSERKTKQCTHLYCSAECKIIYPQVANVVREYLF